MLSSARRFFWRNLFFGPRRYLGTGGGGSDELSDGHRSMHSGLIGSIILEGSYYCNTFGNLKVALLVSLV